MRLVFMIALMSLLMGCAEVRADGWFYDSARGEMCDSSGHCVEQQQYRRAEWRNAYRDRLEVLRRERARAWAYEHQYDRQIAIHREREEEHRDRRDELPSVDHSERCPRTFRGVGLQQASEHQAREAAVVAWGDQVKYDIGEKFADFRNAEGLNREAAPSFSCNIASTSETIIAQGERAIFHTQPREFWRCSVEARACRPKPRPIEH